MLHIWLWVRRHSRGEKSLERKRTRMMENEADAPAVQGEEGVKKKIVPSPLFFHQYVKNAEDGLYVRIKDTCEAALPNAGWLPSDGNVIGTWILRSMNHFCLEQV